MTLVSLRFRRWCLLRHDYKSNVSKLFVRLWQARCSLCFRFSQICYKNLSMTEMMVQVIRQLICGLELTIRKKKSIQNTNNYCQALGMRTKKGERRGSGWQHEAYFPSREHFQLTMGVVVRVTACIECLSSWRRLMKCSALEVSFLFRTYSSGLLNMHITCISIKKDFITT